MKNRFLIIILVVFLGCKNTNEIKKTKENINMNEVKKGRVIGIGGIFFKSQNPKQLKEWYSNNLGMKTDDYGTLFEFRKSEEPFDKAYLQWSPFNEKTTYFQPSNKEFMINYRVENIELLIEDLKKNGVRILDTLETYDYGKFIHILDPEGNKIEFWEAVDNKLSK